MTENTGISEQQAKGAAATVCVGALLAVLGTFAAWITVTTGFGDLSRSGLDWSGDAKWLIGLAALAVLGSLSKVTGWQVPKIIAGSALIDGAIMLAICIYDMTQVEHRATAAKAVGGSVQVGAGLWLSLVGSAAVILGGFLMLGGWPGMVGWLKGIGVVHSDPEPVDTEMPPRPAGAVAERGSD